MGTLKKSPKSELWTEEVARGRLLLLSCATQVWKSELPSFLSRSTPSFVESKGVYVIFESASDLEAELSKLGIEKVDKPCKEAAQGRLMIWRRRLSKSPTSLRFSISTRQNKYDVVDNNLNSVFARLRSITNQYNRGSTCYCQIDSDIGLVWDQTRIHQNQLLYLVITKTEPILVSLLLPLQMLQEALLIFISPSLD
ncbi:unnamed protein product [Brassica oleracea var. botrytis]